MDMPSTPERNCGTRFLVVAVRLSGERLSSVGPAEGLGHGGIEVGNELLDPGLEYLLACEIAAADQLSHQYGEPDFDLVEP